MNNCKGANARFEATLGISIDTKENSCNTVWMESPFAAFTAKEKKKLWAEQ